MSFPYLVGIIVIYLAIIVASLYVVLFIFFRVKDWVNYEWRNNLRVKWMFYRGRYIRRMYGIWEEKGSETFFYSLWLVNANKAPQTKFGAKFTSLACKIWESRYGAKHSDWSGNLVFQLIRS